MAILRRRPKHSIAGMVHEFEKKQKHSPAGRAYLKRKKKKVVKPVVVKTGKVSKPSLRTAAVSRVASHAITKEEIKKLRGR